jgi:hypothetical protein
VPADSAPADREALVMTADDQREHDHPHRLLRVLQTVPERHRRRRHGLGVPEAGRDPARAAAPEDPQQRGHHHRGQHEADDR